MANTPYIDLVKPAGTDKALISVLNANSDKIDSAVGGVQDALAIVCNGNTHGAITSGQYVYVRAHETLQEGLYTANSNIAANAALSSSNLTANSSGGLNALNEHIAKVNKAFTLSSAGSDKFTLSDNYSSKKNGIVNVNLLIKTKTSLTAGEINLGTLADYSGHGFGGIVCAQNGSAQVGNILIATTGVTYIYLSTNVAQNATLVCNAISIE